MPQKVKFKIKGMHCTSCAMNIDGELEDLDGVKKASTSYARQETEVEFDEGRVDILTIRETISKTGYEVEG